MTLDEAIEMAAGNLPECWTVDVYVENGAAWCRLDHDGEGVEVDCSDMTLAQQVEACVRTANGSAHGRGTASIGDNDAHDPKR